MKYQLFSLALISFIFIPTSAMAQNTPLNSTDINTKVQKAFESASLEKIARPKTNITIAFPSQNPSQPAISGILKAGESWAQLPIGVITNLPNGKNLSFASIVADVYPNPVDAEKALNGALNNFTIFKEIPIKTLVEKMSKLANIPLLPTQIGSLSSCDSGSGLMKTLGQIAKTNCGSSPIPSDVLKAIPISQTGIQNISYQELATKLDANSIATSAFPLAGKVPLSKLIAPDNFTVDATNVFKLDYLDTKISKQSGNGIKGINPISGSNRVENAPCKDDTCDYAVLLNFVGGTIKENPYNHALALQINSSGTTWLDGGIGSIGRSLWNFKEPPGASLPFSTDYLKPTFRTSINTLDRFARL